MLLPNPDQLAMIFIREDLSRNKYNTKKSKECNQIKIIIYEREKWIQKKIMTEVAS